MEDAEKNEMGTSQAKQDIPLCPNCLAANDPNAYFCSKCGTPMSSYATMDPIASIWARGDTWRKAASRPTRPITLVGMWLLFGVQLLTLLFLLLHTGILYGTGETPVSTPDLINFGLVTGMIVVYCAILFKTTRNYYRHKKLAKDEPAPSQCNPSD